VGGSNPSGDGGGPRLKSPPGKGNKPVALADITNVGRPNTTSRSVSIGDVLKVNFIALASKTCHTAASRLTMPFQFD
jgi:hypothetical protein